MDWRIYYSDGSTFDSSMGDPSDAPPWDIQVIAEKNEAVGRRLHSKADFYLFVDGAWVGVDMVGMVDHLVNVLGIVKVGRMIDRERYREIMDQAHHDPFLPPKSGWLRDEPRG